MNRFTEFTGYQHRVLTSTQGKVYSMPINLATINAFFGVALRPSGVPAFMASKIPSIPEPSNLEEKAISLIGVELYEAFIKGYTVKQWGLDPRELPASIITRLPVRYSYDDRYFNDRYQGMPVEGYGRMFERLLEGDPRGIEHEFHGRSGALAFRMYAPCLTAPSMSTLATPMVSSDGGRYASRRSVPGWGTIREPV